MQDDSATPASDLFARWQARLQSNEPDHARFVGDRLGAEGLGPLALGRLWALARRVQSMGEAASEPARLAVDQFFRLFAFGSELRPAFDADSALQTLRLEHPGRWNSALRVLQRLAGPPTPEIRAELDRVLGPRDDWPKSDLELLQKMHEACVLARHAEPDRLPDFRAHLQEVYAELPYLRAEFETFLQISPASLLAASAGEHGYHWPGTDAPDPAEVLAAEPAYTAFARDTLRAALQRLEDIHAGRIPYKADGAFHFKDTPVIARAARVAAWRDEPWYGELVLRLLPLACVAPTAAKTVPSQSLAIAMGHSIEGVPTPESVQALRAALSAVQHAGVQKKLARNLKPAERALAARPEVALRVTGASAKPDKKQQAMVARCLEAGWWTGLRWSTAQWLQQIAASPNGRPFATGLVWVAEKPDGAPPVSFVLRADAGGPAFVDARSSPVAWDEACAVRLWHPAAAPLEEKRSWQEFFYANQKARQPLRQVFRETYPVSGEGPQANATAAFAGHELSIRPLIGLARREGWQVDKYTGLVRVFGTVRATFRVDAELYPGLEGACESMDIVFEQAQGRAWRRLGIGEMDPVVFSEACRAVDLLVSATAFAIDDGTSGMPLTAADLGVHLASGPAPAAAAGPAHPRVARMRRLDHLATLPLAGMARMRCETLARAFAPQVAAGRVVFDTHHVRVGDSAVHLATARATHRGEPVDLDPLAAAKAPKLAAVPWLPYDEALLQRIAERVCALLDGAA